MIVLKRWVWPGCKFLVALVIAVALVRLAFAPPAAADAASGPTATGAVTEPIATAERASIHNDVVVKARIDPAPSVTVKAPAAGTVTAVKVAAGQAVGAGAVIAQIKTETPVAPAAGADPLAPTPKPKVTYTDVQAAVGGTAASVVPIVGQEVAIGDTVATVAPGSFTVTGKLDAAQLYRLLQRPTEASVAVTNGPAPFTCTNLTIGAVRTADTSNGSGSGTGTGSGTGDSGAGTSSDGPSMQCDVPADATVFAGLAATVTIAGGSADDVVTIPLTAVEGSAGTGTVTVVSGKGDKQRAPREVTLGINDGERVEVTGGLAAGDKVLAFVPGADAPESDETGGGMVVIG